MIDSWLIIFEKTSKVEKHSGFDVLVQNAGFAFKGSSTEPRDVQTRETFKINVWGLLNVMKKFYPIIRENGRMVNMSSFVSQMTEFGYVKNVWSDRQFKTPINNIWHNNSDSRRNGDIQCKAKLVNWIKLWLLKNSKKLPENMKPIATPELMKKKVGHKHHMECQSFLWMLLPKSTGKTRAPITRTFLNHFRIIAKNDNRGVLINCCSPGYVKTDMSGNKGGTTWDIGARTSVWLSLLPAGMDGPQGCYLAEI